jgi:hypothetical protein
MKSRENQQKYTAYCGLYCLDCIPSHKSLFHQLKELEELLEELKFGKYAELKSKDNEVFKEYPTFLKVLGEIKALKCVALCTEGGCKEHCKIRECVISKNYEGCWECPGFRDCELLLGLKKIHPLEHNLELIKKHGVDNWSDKRGKHYLWL